MTQMQYGVDIARPLEEVLAFANPGNDARWGSNLVQVTQLSPTPLGWEPGCPTRPASLVASLSSCGR
jgi:hypothetical protein